MFPVDAHASAREHEQFGEQRALKNKKGAIGFPLTSIHLLTIVGGVFSAHEHLMPHDMNQEVTSWEMAVLSNLASSQSTL